MTEPRPDFNSSSVISDTEELAGDHEVAFDIATDRLEECRRQFEETGNGIYSWEAVAICTGRYMERYGGVRPRPFPDWLMAYLGGAATDITNLGNLNHPATRPDRAAAGGDNKLYEANLSAWQLQKIKPTEAPDMALTALKLDASGTANRFSQYSTDMQNLSTGIFVKFLGRQAVFEASKQKDISGIDKKSARAKEIRPRLTNKLIQKN